MNQSQITHQNMEAVFEHLYQDQPNQEAHQESNSAQLRQEAQKTPQTGPEPAPNPEDHQEGKQDLDSLLASSITYETAPSLTQSSQTTSRPETIRDYLEDDYIAPIGDTGQLPHHHQQTAGLEAFNSQSDSVVVKTTKNCLPSLPNKKERFTFGFEIDLDNSATSLILPPLYLSLGQKLYTTIIFAISDRWVNHIHLNYMLPLTILLSVLFRHLPNDSIQKHTPKMVLFYAIELHLLVILYNLGLKDRRTFFYFEPIRNAFFLFFCMNLAADLALVVTVKYSGQRTLESRRVYSTTLIIFFVLTVLTCSFFDGFLYDHPIPALIKTLAFGVLCSTVAAKEVLILKERLDLKGGVAIDDFDRFDHAMTGRMNAWMRQALLVCSKLWNE